MSACTSSSDGRPKVKVDIAEVMSLRSLDYSWTKISEMVSVSRSTTEVYDENQLIYGGVANV